MSEEEKIAYQGRMIEIVEKEVQLGSGKKIFEYARRSPGVRLIIPKGTTILLSREFRHELQKYDYRLPGGKVFDSLEDYNSALSVDRDIQDAAKKQAVREAIEEVGIEVKNLSFLHKSICGATVVWDLFYFLVNDFADDTQHLEDGEDITVEYVEREKAKAMCLDGSMSEERSALILLRYLEGQLTVSE